MNFLYAPFAWILRIVYEFVGSYGWSLVLFTLITRFILLPSTIHQQKGSAKQLRIQPKLNKIRLKYASNQKKMQEEMQALYQREGYNPMNQGCLPLLIQVPIIYGLHGVIYKPLTYVLNLSGDTVSALTKAVENIILAGGQSPLTEISKKTGELVVTAKAKSSIELYALNYKHEVINSIQGISQDIINSINNFDFNFLGVPMGAQPDFKVRDLLWLIPVLSGVSSLLSSIYMYVRQLKTNPEMAKNPSMGCMILGMPLFSVYLAFKLPAGIGIYWIISNIFSFIQTVILGFIYSPKKVIASDMVRETILRRSKENNLKLASKNN